MRPSAIILILLAVRAMGQDLETLLPVELPRLDGEGAASVADHLEPGRRLCLVLWNVECPECLENLSQLGVAPERPDLRLLGVNFDVRRWDALDAVAERRPGFPQLYDSGGLIAQSLRAEEYSFSLALLDAEGSLLAIHYDSVADATATLDEILSALDRAPDVPRLEALGGRIRLATEDDDPVEAPPLLSVEASYPQMRGEGRLRLRALAVALEGDEGDGECDCPLAGPYGQDLRERIDLLFRAEYELEVRVAPGVSAGAKLRVAHENPDIMRLGPEYLGNPLGSVYAEWRGERWSSRCGYFSAHFTPLTLQRWDFADNPPAAGTGGASCASCGGAARGIVLDALDDLGPDIVFEGLLLDARPLRPLSLAAFYALPQRAGDFDSYDVDAFAYRRDLLAGRAAIALPIRGAWSTRLTLQGFSADEDGASAHYPGSPNNPTGFIHKNRAGSLGLELSLPTGGALALETA